MPIRALIIAAAVVVLAAVVYTQIRPTQVDPAPLNNETAQEEPATPQGDGPILVIEVAGEANGTIEIELFDQTAPDHVERLVTLAENGSYNGVVFHRVIEGFMAQSGDVEFGNSAGDTSRAGMGGSDLPDLNAEFSDVPFERGVLGMARAANPNSANSQFFIMFAPAPHLNGQYTVVGKVVNGLDVLDQIKLGRGPNGAIIGDPDVMRSVTVRR